ncbi:MAG: Thioredoxin-disulfide reductase [Frankiales bacterium]|nr:Thioredoxin-disulfide reductase [Frankiales bacterium]
MPELPSAVLDRPLPETPDLHGAFPRLSDAQIQSLQRFGERRPIARGDVLFHEGEHTAQFFVVLSGQVVVLLDADVAPKVIRVHGPGRFLGELSLLTGQVSLVTAMVNVPGEVLAVGIDRLRALVLEDAELGDLILRAFLMRRSLLISEGSGVRIIGSRFSPDSHRLRAFCARNRLPYKFLDIDQDSEADAVLQQFGVPTRDLPVVAVPGGRLLRNPSNAELAAQMGLHAPQAKSQLCDVVVVGAGPAGLAAAVYGASEGLDTVVLDAVASGGQAAASSRIENYLGFPAGISGGELAERAAIQAAKFGARITVPGEAVALSLDSGHYRLRLDGVTSLTTRTVVLATGARYRKLDVPRLEEFELTSVYYAATRFEALECGTDPVAVVGGGNSAGQAAVFLAQQVPQVWLLIRHDDLGKDMSRYLVDQVEANPRITVRRHTEVRELLGASTLEALVVEDNRTGQRTTLAVRALFVFIGATPCTSWLAGSVHLDEKGYVLTGDRAAQGDGDGGPLFLETSRRGVFAVGDVRSGSVKRVASAVGEGAMAVRLLSERLA